MTKMMETMTSLTAFINDFSRTFFYFIQSALLFIVHLVYHIAVKTKILLRKYIVPSYYDIQYSTRFFVMVVLQGIFELMAVLCIFLSSILIKGGRFFNNRSERLLQKYWW